MRIVCISDTHRKHRELDLPEGDMLIHAGDITSRGEISTLVDFISWIKYLPFKHKVIICGNHDFCFQNERSGEAHTLMDSPDFHYLQDSGIEIEGLNIYGSPWTPWFHDWAFNAERGSNIKYYWDAIPTNTDVLITHGPPLGHGDRVLYPAGLRVGCEDLLNRVKIIKPKLHVFGHIHEDAGKWDRYWDKGSEKFTTFVNAASCNLSYVASNPPIVVDI